MTTYVIPGGDLLEAARTSNLIKIFGHGCNCWCTMGAGIANHVRLNFPALFEADVADQRSPDQRLGGFSYAFDHDSNAWGANLYTQFYPGPHARMPSVISSVQSLFEQVHEIVEAAEDETVFVGLPALGCGIGGLDLHSVITTVDTIAESVREYTRRRVVPVFYIMESVKFSSTLQELSVSLDQDINVVESESEILDLESKF